MHNPRSLRSISQNYLGIQSWDRGIPTVLAHMVVFMAIGAVGYLITISMRVRRLTKLERGYLYIVALLWAWIVFSVWGRIPWPDAWWAKLAFWWLAAIPFGTLGDAVLKTWDKLGKPFYEMTDLDSQLSKQSAEREKLLHRERAAGLRHSERDHRQHEDRLFLGTYLKGDIIPTYLGFSTTSGWMTMENRLLNQHVFILGTTGAGKSETLLKIIEQVLQNTNRNLYFVDGKGDLEFAMKVATLIAKSGRGKAHVFKL